jgi:hypothetical protein
MVTDRVWKLSGLIAVLLFAVSGLCSAGAAENRRSAPAPAEQSAPTTALFAHVAIGGGFSTLFTLLNTGNDSLTGSLILTKSDGTPMDATLNERSTATVQAPSAGIVIPPGGVRFIEATGNPDTLIAGWARVESTGGSPGGVATFQLQSGPRLISVAGVLSAEETSVATIPVADDAGQGRYTGYAAANHGSGDISIRIVLVNADGSTRQVLRPPLLNPLKAGNHVARFLFQDLNDPAFKFQGSMVLISDSGGEISVVALVQSDGAAGPLYTAIPVIRSKAPNIY